MKRILALVVLFFLACTAGAQSSDEAAIRSAAAAQVDAWNHGDIDTFMKTYEDSPDTTFIGLNLRKGYQNILARYKKAYSLSAQMGKLSFTDLDVRMLPSACGQPEIALVTGRFHLDRTEKGEATKDDGIFSLPWFHSPVTPQSPVSPSLS
jgi:ketosteroid isomerase-like protein